MKKKLFLFIPIIAALAFSGCMTAQVEIRMEYDKLTKAITAVEDKRDDYLKPAASDTVKGILGYIYDAAKDALATAKNASDAPQDVKVSLITMGFKVESISTAEKRADAYFTLLAGEKNMVFLFPISPLMPPAPIEINLHKYKVTADSNEIPLYNLIFDYVKINGEWKINGVKDGDSEIYPLSELMAA